MRTVEFTQSNGKRILVHVERVDIVIEHSSRQDRTFIVIGNDSWEVCSPYDEVIRHIPYD